MTIRNCIVEIALVPLMRVLVDEERLHQKIETWQLLREFVKEKMSYKGYLVAVSVVDVDNFLVLMKKL